MKAGLDKTRLLEFGRDVGVGLAASPDKRVVLVVNHSASRTVAFELAEDLDQESDGNAPFAHQITRDFVETLAGDDEARGDIAKRITVEQLHIETDGGNEARLVRELLVNVLEDPNDAPKAWSALVEDANAAIAAGGRRTRSTLLRLLRARGFRLRRGVRAMGPPSALFVATTGLVSCAILALGGFVLSRPTLTFTWQRYPAANNQQEDVSDLDLKTGETASGGMRDLSIVLDGYDTIDHAEVLDAGGCEGVHAHVERRRLLSRKDWNYVEGNTSKVSITATRCPSGAVAHLRLGVGQRWFSGPLRSDSMTLAGSYSWLLPVVGWRSPWRHAFRIALPPPNDLQFRSLSFPTRAYPVSIMDPPFYWDDARSGKVLMTFDQRDYAMLRRERKTVSLWNLSSPSVRGSLAISSDGTFTARVATISCPAMTSGGTAVPASATSSFGIGLPVLWTDCHLSEVVPVWGPAPAPAH